MTQNQPKTNQPRRPRILLWVGGGLTIAILGFVTTAVLVSVFEHKQEAKNVFVRLVEVNEVSTDPIPWGTNWPNQFDAYKRTVDDSETKYGGSSAMPASKLAEHPWLQRLYSGYAFSIDYREARGHAYMLYDQEVTERVTERKQSGSCLHCHASIIPTYRRLGLQAKGLPTDEKSLASAFNWPAVLDGFKIASAMDYSTAHAELFKTPDGTPRESESGQRQPSEAHANFDGHSVSCIDCHDPNTMQIRVTRPGFILGIAALAESDDPVPHLPSIARWRSGDRSRPYDPMIDASRQEMRSFVCGQCHVEYYCASKEPLFFPWNKGLKVEQIEATYNEHKFPDGKPFQDFVHGETGAPVFKAQHPEFELWSQGVHARSGVSCADCHMPYERQGAMKVSNHWVRSPLLNISAACQTCHRVPEAELLDKAKTIQGRTTAMIERAANAMTNMLDAIREAQAAGATTEQLAPIFEWQKKAMWRLDFISSENSDGFHADQESVRILAESIDYSRQAEVAAVRLRAAAVPDVKLPREPVYGVTTPAGKEKEPKTP